MMEATKVFNVFYDSDLDAVVMEWNGYSTSQQFRQGTELMLNMLIKHNAHKVLANVKDMTIVGREDQIWVEEDFLPRAISFGFKELAIIRPDHYFNKVAMETISYKVDKEKLSIMFFDNLSEAIAWLVSK